MITFTIPDIIENIAENSIVKNITTVLTIAPNIEAITPGIAENILTIT